MKPGLAWKSANRTSAWDKDQLTTVKNNGCRSPLGPDDLTRIASLLLELPEGALFQGLVGVDQAGRKLNDHLASRRSELLFEQNFKARAIDGIPRRDDVDGVDGAVLGSCGATHGLPCAHHAVGGLVLDSDEARSGS